MLATRLFIGPSSVVRSSTRFRSFNKVKQKIAAGLVLGSPEDYAYNYVEKKDGFLKPVHTIEEQINYMKSKEFEETYKGRPIYHMYKRNIKCQWKIQPPPRLFCIDRNGRFNVNNPCPVCRDEYLFFDYRNPDLIKHFLMPGTGKLLSIVITGLCREQYINLQAQMLKAKEYGTLPFSVEFRHFNYSEWYPDLAKSGDNYALFETDEDMDLPTRHGVSVHDVYPDQYIEFPTHKRDIHTKGDEWWHRHDKFSKKLR